MPASILIPRIFSQNTTPILKRTLQKEIIQASTAHSDFSSLFHLQHKPICSWLLKSAFKWFSKFAALQLIAYLKYIPQPNYTTESLSYVLRECSWPPLFACNTPRGKNQFQYVARHYVRSPEFMCLRENQHYKSLLLGPNIWPYRLLPIYGETVAMTLLGWRSCAIFSLLITKM